MQSHDRARLSNTVNSSPPTERDAWVRHFAGAFENAVIGMTLLGTDKRRLSVNRAFCEFLGYNESELLALTLEDVVHSGRPAGYPACNLPDASPPEGQLPPGTPLPAPARATSCGDFSCTLARDLDGQPLFYITQVQDITERNFAEQRLRDTQAMLHLAAQVGGAWAWAWDVGAATLQWSQEACAIFEVKPGFAPTPAQAMRFIAPAYRANIGATLKACLRGGSPSTSRRRSSRPRAMRCGCASSAKPSGMPMAACAASRERCRTSPRARARSRRSCV